MNQTLFYLTTLFLSLFALKVEAQTIQDITPENAINSALEIKRMYGAAINVSDTQIKEFYLSHWATVPHSNSCEIPDADVTDVNNTSVSLEWLDTGSGSYRARYLSLSNGNTGGASTTTNSISIDLDDDLYLLTVQSKCGGFSSALSIIIIEKPILMDFLTNCNCPRYYNLWNSPFDLLNPAIYDWPFLNTTKTLYVEVIYFNSPTVSFVAEIDFGSTGPEEVRISQACMTNVGLNPDGTQLLAYDGSITQGVFGFSHEINVEEGEEADPQFSFSASENAAETSGKIYLYQCKSKVGNRNNNMIGEEIFVKSQQPSLSVLNVPTKDFSTLVCQLPEAAPINLSLINMTGESIRQIKDIELLEQGTHHFSIDLRDLPSGIYYCVLKTPSGNQSVRLLKI